MVIPMVSPDSTPKFRRNGKRPSCEPCRKSKLSCDHNTPICGRCRRRGIESQCTVHPAPLTGSTSRTHRQDGIRKSTNSKQMPLNEGADVRASHASRRQILPSPRPSEPSDLSSPNIASSNTSSSPGLTTISRRSLPINRTPGFLGSTSYAAVFEENRDAIITDFDRDKASSSRNLCMEVETADTEMINEGARVLSRFCELYPALSEVTSPHKCMEQLTVLAPVMMACAEAVKRLLKDLIQLPERERNYHEVSRDIFYNTVGQYLPRNITDHKRMSHFFTEPLRWEAVGMATCIWGPGAVGGGMQRGDPLDIGPGKEGVSRTVFAKMMVLNGSSCLSFCEELGSINDLSIWLLYENALITSFVYGDSNYLTWRRLGDVSTAVFAMGLHQEIKPSKDLPFFLCEVRKNMFARAYYTDKELGTFLGRPPRISQRYCVCQLPLDLSIDEIGLEPASLEKALESLDSNGWNREGKTQGATWDRAILINSLFREDILELSLGLVDTATLTTRAEDIIQRQELAWASFPPHLLDWRSLDKFSIGYLFLDRLYNDFLLQRTLIKYTRHAPTELLKTARQMLISVLNQVSFRMNPTAYEGDMAWMVCIYGLPSGAVLALDLLLQHQNAEGWKRHALFSRSETIQNLSVLTSCLGWIYKEGEGNFDLCSNARRVIQGILDHVLSPPEPSTSGPLDLPNHSSFEPNQIDVGSSMVSETGTTGLTGDLLWFDNNSNYFDNDFWMNLAGQVPDLGPG